MKIYYLGQAGLAMQTDELKIMIDPYLSNVVERYEPQNRRRQPIDERWFDFSPDVIIFTHDHLDHYDPETACRFLREDTAVTVLAPRSAWEKAIKNPGNHNFVQFNPHTEWTQGNVRFTAVKAEHSDPDAIGVIIDDGEHKYYITGDTLYNDEIFDALPDDLYAVFLPINGVGNNMNITDAARFAQRTGARFSVPYHVGMFDSLSAEDFPCDNKIIPEIYEEIVLK